METETVIDASILLVTIVGLTPLIFVVIRRLVDLRRPTVGTRR